jgi:hypothetical protein
MTPPSQTEMQVFAAACGILISGSFMRYVLKPKGAAATRKAPRDRR